MDDTTNLDTLIARNIGDIEAALEHAHTLGDALIEEMADLLRSELGDRWEILVDTNDDHPLRIARQEWRESDAPSARAGYSFIFDQRPGPGHETDNTWLSKLLGAGPAGASVALYFWSDSFWTKRRWRRLLQDQEAVIEKLLDAGFRQDSDQWLYLPLAIDTETLAEGYERGDLTLALRPAVEVAATIKACGSAFDTLVARDKIFE